MNKCRVALRFQAFLFRIVRRRPVEPLTGFGERRQLYGDPGLWLHLRLRSIFGSRRVDNGFHPGDVIGGKPTHPRVLLYDLFVRRDVNAVKLVVRNVALEPLNLWSKFIQDVARTLR